MVVQPDVVMTVVPTVIDFCFGTQANDNKK